MKLVYLTVDGRELVSNWKVNSRILEMGDGYHPVTNDSVWQDSKRLLPARMVLIQGVLPPMGATMAHEDMRSILTEKIITEHGFRRSGVSTMLMRWLGNAFEWLTSHIVYLFIAGVVGFSLLGSAGVI